MLKIAPKLIIKGNSRVIKNASIFEVPVMRIKYTLCKSKSTIHIYGCAQTGGGEAKEKA